MIDGTLVQLKEPSINDYHYVREIWEDENTMQDVGGICLLPEKKYQNWHRYMFQEKKEENAYFLIFEKENRNCIGEISFHRFDKELKKAMFNVKIKKEYRNKGFGKESIDLILDFYFNIWNGEVMEDSIWIENRNGLEVLKKYGFKVVKTDEDGIWIEINKKIWNDKKSLTIASTG